MDAELRRRVDALRRPLELAAADNFGGVRRVAGLGHALRAACDGVIARIESPPLAHWRTILGTWETLDENQQAVEVARGMRLIRVFGARPASSVSVAATVSATVPVSVSVSVSVSASASASAAAAAAVSVPVSASAAAAATAPKKPRAKRATATPTAAASTTVLDPLAAPTQSLPGIGPAFAERLAARGLITVEDLLWMVPRRYDDVRNAHSLTALDLIPDGERATFVARVTSARMIFARGRRWAEVRLTTVTPPHTTTAVVRWFNVWAGIDKRMPPDSIVSLSGAMKRRGGKLELANPDILGIETPDPPANGAPRAAPAIMTRYPDIAGVPPSRLRQACATACARVAAIADDGVPPEIAASSGMPSLSETLAHLHSPPPDVAPDDLAAMNRGDSRWQRRLAFGELFALGIAVARRRRERNGDAAVPCAPAPDLDATLARALPFVPTAAQRRSIAEIAGDLSRPVPMNRLLQGDVGAGKTAVAFAAALHVARAGRQTAVMAPTELLAEQHFETWRRWATAAGAPALRIELLTASTPRGVRQSIIALTAAGQIDIMIGTHALLADALGFGALGLVVIDEQHRFGVAQRARLRAKDDGQGAPHLLVMTATPIPRTLALTAYGDLDVSILDELPPGRQPARTRVLSGARGQSEAYRVVAERVAAGERVYVVCPKVEPNEPEDGDDAPSRPWKDATTVAGELTSALPSARVGLVHGRLDSPTRDRVMRAFRDGEVDVLVATTVIEVGVDVPQATTIIIHDAERFGLAQLHQLRGRVGRGGGAAECILLAQGSLASLGPDGTTRLDAMVATHDGFQIAEQDLALRGPGELFGDRQAGAPRLRFGTLAQHTELLLEARRQAELLLDADPELVRPAHAALRRALERRLAGRVFGAEAG